MVDGKIVIHGYTFGITGTDDLQVLDSRGDPVPFEQHVESSTEGEGDIPGSVQVASHLHVQVLQPISGMTYRILFLDLDLRVTAA
jgi:hypothetical protein